MTVKSGIVARPFAGEEDLLNISALLSESDALLDLGIRRTPNELRQTFDSPRVNRARDTRLWIDRTGHVLAYALLEIPASSPQPQATLRFRAHPSYAVRLDPQVIAWALVRVHELAAAAGKPGQLLTFISERDTSRKSMVEILGFTPARFFRRLARDLDREIEAPKFPQGFTVRSANPAVDGPKYIQLFNESFFDHWDHHDLTLAEYMHDRTSVPSYDPQHDLIVLSREGMFAAFCWSFGQGDGEALLHQIGTRQGFRRMGIGRAILRTALQTLQRDGFRTVNLIVDSQNPNEAQSLYESEGFQLRSTLVAFGKQVSHERARFVQSVD